MFAIAAINDNDSKEQWEPLAPTKEAQEFHLTQTYHDGLLKLQTKEYAKARELLEAVVRDPLVPTAQAESTAGDGHLLQLKFLALKNLATVFLRQGDAYYENALHCYFQAVEIDTKDMVVWNQLGTLACSMGLLSTSRWAFEQGLVCSPNNWNCMEKLLEVLIAIGDEVACLSVAELILRHWPSHARALHVQRTIEDSEPEPFAPRGIDKLEPKHVRLKFSDKRKASSSNLEEDFVSKKLKQTVELELVELSWTALADAILEILHSRDDHDSQKKANKRPWTGDTKVAICLPSKNQIGEKSTIGSIESNSDICNRRDERDGSQKEARYYEEQTHERRSSRLVSLRSHKPGKEDTDFSGMKDMAKLVIQILKPFIIIRQPSQDFDYSPNDALDSEAQVVKNFVMQASRNFGAYHLGHLLLEEIAKRGFLYRDSALKFLELEKMTRLWACDRTPECSLFLGELYHDLGSSSSRMSEFMSEASYSLSKVIESVASDWPLNSVINWGESCSTLSERSQNVPMMSTDCSQWFKSLDSSLLLEKSSFWVRFFWLSGHVSMWEGNRARALEELTVSLSLLENNRNLNDIPGSIQLPHCKFNKELTTDKILHEINLLQVQFLLKNTIAHMLEKEMHSECIELLTPLLLSTRSVHSDTLPIYDKDEGLAMGEVSALDVLIAACEKDEPFNIEVYLNCHRRKLQILMVKAGMEDFVSACDLFTEKSLHKIVSTFGSESSESSGNHVFDTIADQVKELSKCASLVKNWIDQHKAVNGVTVPTNSIGEIQILLLVLMCNIARSCFSKKSSGATCLDQTEQKQRCLFVNAAIAFCKLQHLDRTITNKTQVDLIVAIHDLLAEFGLCCVGEDGEGVDGTFLKLAIKHLLALDMKLKSDVNSVSERIAQGFSPIQTSGGVASPEKRITETCQTAPTVESDEVIVPDSLSPPASEHENGQACRSYGASSLTHEVDPSARVEPAGSELAEDEREELESAIDNALNQCFFCLYGLNLRSDSSYEEELAVHRNTSQADYQSKEQCADVFKYILPYAKASTKTGLLKLRKVLRAIRKHFLQPPDNIFVGNPIDKYLDDPNICEDKLSEEAGSDTFLESVVSVIFPDTGIIKLKKMSVECCEPYMEVYSNLYYLLAQSEETSATDKWPGFVLTKEGEEFVEQSASLSKYDLLFNPLRFESWQRLATVYDEEVDLLLNDGSKNINVAGWRKNASLPQRVETSRRRSRRCLLMSLALAKTSEQQSEIHELLALVYYDGVQNVVPFYDQRSVAPVKDANWMMFCKNSKKHFEKAFAHRQDWSHAFYLGKLCEKLGCSSELSFSYYDKAIALNPSSVDAIYRMHASRMKLLYTCQKNDLVALKVSATYAFDQSANEKVMNILDTLQTPHVEEAGINITSADCDSQNHEKSHELERVWQVLYSDCVSALETCVEGDLKHFHKARYMLAQGLYKRGESGDLDKAKDEISFCFKSSRSSFTINMWEIDSTVKKGRRRAPSVAGSKKILEVNLPESSRKFITCIRKYLLLYLKLLEKTGDVSTLDRAYVSIRTDKRFSLCLEDLLPVALGRYLKALISSMRSADGTSSARNSPEQILEKMFTLFMEQGGLWPDMCNLPEIKSSKFTESRLFGYVHQYLYSLEGDARLESLEGINEKIRKRSRNPKLSNSSCTGVFKHASVAWCRSIIINLAKITPLCSSVCGQADADSGITQLLCVDLQTNDFWYPSFGDATPVAHLEAKWNTMLSNVKHVIIKKTSDEHMEIANSLLRSAYSFYRDSSSIVLTSGINLFWVPAHLATAGQFQPCTDGVEIVDMSVPRKLLLWAYTLLHGHSFNISSVVKYCEENIKLKTKKAGAGLSSSVATSMPTALNAHSAIAGGKDGMTSQGGRSVEAATIPSASMTPSVSPVTDISPGTDPAPPTSESPKTLSIAPQLHQCNSSTSNNPGVEKRTFDLNDEADPEKS